MENNWLERAELLVGSESIQKLKDAKVLVVGLGGVGGFAVEFLARAGVGHLTIIDGDEVDATNKNRQIIALDSTVGKSKVQLIHDRIKDINSELQVTAIDQFLTPEKMLDIVGQGFDFVLDCIDTVQPKFHLILACKRHGVKFISSMGAGGKMDVSRVKVDSIWNTENCKLSAEIKKRLKEKKALRKFKVVFSSEQANPKSLQMTDGENFKHSFYGTISYMPAIFGLYMAEHVIRNIIE